MNSYWGLLAVFAAMLLFSGAGLLGELKRYTRGKLLEKVSRTKDLSAAETMQTIRWLHANRLFLDNNDYRNAVALFEWHLVLLGRARELHRNTKDI